MTRRSGGTLRFVCLLPAAASVMLVFLRIPQRTCGLMPIQPLQRQKGGKLLLSSAHAPRTLSVHSILWQQSLRKQSIRFQSTAYSEEEQSVSDDAKEAPPPRTETKLTKEQKDLLKNWRDHPAINPTLVFPTLRVPSEQLHRWIREPNLQNFLAKPSNWSLLFHVHPRIKMVKDIGDDDDYKLLLLLQDENNDKVIESQLHEGQQLSLEKLLRSDVESLQVGPKVEIPLTFHQLSFNYILSQLLPEEAHPLPAAYEQIGHVAHFNLKQHHAGYGELIGQVLRETHPSMDTVVNKKGEVKGKYRTYDLELLAGPPIYETTAVEHGVPICHT